MANIFNYAATEMLEQFKRGPYEGEDFFRMQVSGNGKTRWVNISPAALVRIATILDQEEK